MRALTVKQPWAYAIAAGLKNPENRSKDVGYRGALAIHAGLAVSARNLPDERAGLVFELAGGRGGLWQPRSQTTGPLRDPLLALGAVIAVTELVDCHPDQACCRPWGESDYVESGGRRRTAIWHLVLEQVRALSVPVPCRGWLGLWRLPPDVQTLVDEQLAVA